MIYFTSDTHFGHANIIKYSKRPFANVENMNEELIRRWNERVLPSDTIYHLGDVAFLKENDTKNILRRLNGHKYLCPGNHDKNVGAFTGFWDGIHERYEIKIDGRHIVLSHYGHRVWNKSHHGSLMLYGHSHGSLPGNSQSLDVGVDCWDYRPVTLNEILIRMAKLPQYIGEDHHGKDREV